MITNKKNKIIAIATATWGILLISSGLTMQLMTKQEKPKTKVTVIQKRVQDKKTNEIKLKDMELEINHPLSVNIQDYLINPENIESKILKKLRLDTSLVNVNQAGSYTYTITYKKKKYNGTFIIKEKPLPTISSMTLKNLSLKKGSTLSTDIKNYVVETLPEEIITNIKLDLTNVNTAAAGNYQYTITYDNKLYTGTITIYEPQEVKQEEKSTIKSDEENENPSDDEKQNQEKKEESITNQ